MNKNFHLRGIRTPTVHIQLCFYFILDTQYRNFLTWLTSKEPTFKLFTSSYMSTAEYEFDWYDSNGPRIFRILDELIPDSSYRLPDMLYPELYNISLAPDMERGTFDGKVQIYMKTNRDTSSIVLNSHNLNIESAKAYKHYMAEGTNPRAEELQVMDYYINKTSQILKIYLNEFVNTKNVMVEIKFNGTLNDDMEGFYRSSYLDASGTLQ